MSTTPRYTSVATLKARHGLNDTSRDDAEYASAILAAEALIDTHCGRTFDKAGPTPRTFAARGRGRFVSIDDAQGVALVETSTTGQAGTFTAFAGYVARSNLGQPVTMLDADLGCFPVGRGAWVRVTPTTGWGWAEVPDQVQEATLLHAAKLFKRKDSPEGAIGFADVGVLNVKPGLDPDAKALIADLRRLERWAP